MNKNFLRIINFIEELGSEKRHQLLYSNTRISLIKAQIFGCPMVWMKRLDLSEVTSIL